MDEPSKDDYVRPYIGSRQRNMTSQVGESYQFMSITLKNFVVSHLRKVLLKLARTNNPYHSMSISYERIIVVYIAYTCF